MASPGVSPRPARPATWVSSWNVRSAARKSARPEADVRRDHADERHARKIVALGDHLRADEDVDARRRHDRDSTRVDRAAPPDRVAIDARDPRAGKLRRAARPRAARCRTRPARDTRRRTRRSACGTRRAVVAVVAAHAPAGALWNGQRHAAVRALERRAALPAEHRPSRSRAGSAARSPARLGSADRSSASTQRRGSSTTSGAVGRVLLAHVDDAHRRQRPIEDPPRRAAPVVAAGRAFDADLERRRRRPEHDQRAVRARRAPPPRRGRGSAAPRPACTSRRAPRRR